MPPLRGLFYAKKQAKIPLYTIGMHYTIAP